MPRRITVAELTGMSPKDANFVIEYCKDFSPRRAAEASGLSADTGYEKVKQPHIAAAIDRVLVMRLEASNIDAEWVLMEAVDNHMIARQKGHIAASNTALTLIAKHVFVDAFAAEKVELNSDKEVMERLVRGRKRLSKKSDDEVSFL